MQNELLKTLTLGQRAELTSEMKSWVKDCQWGENYEDGEIDAMTDEELLRGIENHYSGGLTQFIKDTVWAAQSPTVIEGHTPGEWHRYIQPSEHEGLVTTINVGSKRIATLSFVGIEETEANALIICSAPRLKRQNEELRAILPAITEILLHFKQAPDWSEEHELVLLKLKTMLP